MLYLALLCAALTAAIHFYIFYLELLAYGASNFRRVFQIPPEHLPIVRAPFNNLAIYNIALALAAALGIGCLVAVSAATALAARIAEQAGITLIGFARMQKCTVYSHPQYLASEEAA